jgi:hypothetical protein
MGSAGGGAASNANSVLTVENSGVNYIQMLAPSTDRSGIVFGDEVDDLQGAFLFNNATTADGFEFRVNGNNLAMTIDASGNLGITDGNLTSQGATINTPTTITNTGSPYNGYDVSGITVLRATTTSGSITINDLTGGVNGQILHIVKSSASNQLTVTDTSGSNQNIVLNGNFTVTAANYGGITLVCDGTSWHAIGSYN